MADQERLVTTLMELIKIDSPSGEEDAMDAEVSTRLESLGLKVSHDSYNNVISQLPGEGLPSCSQPIWTPWSRAGASSR